MNNIINTFINVFPNLNPNQIESIFTTDGPVLIIAGPGTGKTLTLILRTLYLLMTKKAKPEEIVITTFTQKAAYELRDRIYQTAEMVGYSKNMNNLKIGTIHTLCNEYISEYISYTKFKKGYKILDEISQILFLNENYSKITKNLDYKFTVRWGSKWNAIKKLIEYFDKITEELIDVSLLFQQQKEFLRSIAHAYTSYKFLLYETNKIDFVHLQKVFYDLLNHPEAYSKIKSNIKYIMVDEYQDTTYIQEQILLKLAFPENNICVVGDDDQAIYRFRGATVRNILRFPSNFKKCKTITLNRNYRSHRSIIEIYNQFINSIFWGQYRYNKVIVPDINKEFADYPAVFCIQEEDPYQEANRVTELIERLKTDGVIEDYSDVAIIFKSVRYPYIRRYIDALENRGIPYFCPRAKQYFENQEIQLIIACIAFILGFYEEQKLNTYSHSDWMYSSFELLYRQFRKNRDNQLIEYLRDKSREIEELESGSLDLTLMDYFYQLLSFEPFSSFLNNKNSAHNLSLFSKLLSLFQEYYNFSVITANNKNIIRDLLFWSFLNFLIEDGIDEFEDEYNPKPKGYVQIMTIHQSKGLEFPVVFVGSLNVNFYVRREVDRVLSPFFKRGTFEPEDMIVEFDRLRHYYVAFSRAMNLLVLTTTGSPAPWFMSIWFGLKIYPHFRLSKLMSQQFSSKPSFIPKKIYSVSDLNLYENCPQQFLYYREFSFEPSRSSLIFFEELVKNTIDDIHRVTLQKKKFNKEDIVDWLDANYENLIKQGLRPISKASSDVALRQVIDYYQQNKDFINNISLLNFKVSLERKDYIIQGNVDLLVNRDGNFEIVEFKVQKKMSRNHTAVIKYINKLCVYAYILSQRYDKPVERMYIYWTSERNRKDALMQIYLPDQEIEDIFEYYDNLVKKIKKQKFDVEEPPDFHICYDCDFKLYCANQGIIKISKRKKKNNQPK